MAEAKVAEAKVAEAKVAEARDAAPETERNAAAPAAEAREVVEELLERLLGRRPGPREVELWSERLSRTASAADFLQLLLGWKRLGPARPASPGVPPGQPGSPVVDPAAVRPYVEENRRAGADGAIAGIAFPLEAMDEFWARNRAVLAQTPFGSEPTPAFRTSFGAGTGPGDAATLRAMIHDRRPQRIVSVGSGAAIAAVLDTLDELGLAVRPTVIDPAPGRLKALLRPGDEARLERVATPVEREPLARFAALGANDIVLVDGSHILKTASDVHHVLFYVLPVLAPRVLVQFANCRFPFEYPDNQIFEKNWSWNEVYALRALLMYSSRFRVAFSASFFAARRNDIVRETFAPFARQPGGALWVEVAGDGSPEGLAAVGGAEPFRERPADPGKQARPELKVVLKPAAGARPGKRHRSRAEMGVGAATLAFDIVEGATGPVYFSLGVRKSGSTMLHKTIALLARANRVNIVDIPGTFFKNGLTAADWAALDLHPLLKPGNIFTGFRTFPRNMGETAAYRDGLKVFMHRDPRDAIVSQYFSDAFSHELPKDSAGDGRQRFLQKRGEAQASDIDAWVVKHAPSLSRTLALFAPTLGDPKCLVVPYETYVFEKRALIGKVVAHFGWTVRPEAVEEILAEVDVRPAGEDPTRFVRKATPGDHKEKLKPETTAELGRIFAEPLALFGYA